MRRFFLCLLGAALVFFLQGFLGFGKDKDSQAMKDLKKKTYIGFTIPYVLRYDADEWDEKCIEWNPVFYSSSRKISITIRINKDEKNLSNNEVIEFFRENMEDCFSDDSLYERIEFKPEEDLVINGIEFVHTNVLVHLKPNSIHFDPNREDRYRKRCIGEKGSTDQYARYTYSGDEGWIAFSIKSIGEISEEGQAVINEFFRGFSFDGSACRGPPKLRRLKTIFEALTDELT